MEFDQFSPNEQPLKKPLDATDNPIEESDTNPDAAPAEDGNGNPDEQTQDSPFGGFNSPEELVHAYETLQELVEHKTTEAQELGQLLKHFGDHAGAAVKSHDKNAFLDHIREIYDQDPVRATALMIKTFQEDALNDFDARLQGRLEHQQNLSRFMNDLLDQPGHSGLKPHENELACLIGEHGVPPQAAVQIIRNVQEKTGTASARRSDAAKAVRNRSMVESPGEVGEPLNKDSKFDKVLKTAKTLDEMFAGLRKLKL